MVSGFFILSYVCLFRIVNFKRYLSLMCLAKLYNIIKQFYIIILYLVFSIKTFLSISFLLVFIDCVSIHLYIEQHNKILHNLNNNNIVYYVENIEHNEINTIERISEDDSDDSITNNTGHNCIDILI